MSSTTPPVDDILEKIARSAKQERERKDRERRNRGLTLCFSSATHNARCQGYLFPSLARKKWKRKKRRSKRMKKKRKRKRGKRREV